MNWNNIELPDKDIYFKDEDSVIYCTDCREILPLIPDKSIDLVLTDPPYTEEMICIFGVIAEQAARILKDGKFLYAYSGAMFLPTIIPAMSKWLEWFWLHNIRHNGGYPSIWKTHIQQNSKPILTFTNGKYDLGSLKWSFTDFTKDKPDKKFHKSWGQGIEVPKEIILMRTDIKDIVLDPCVGGGQMPMASKELGRKCIGVEIEEKYCEIAKRRLSQSVMRFNG